MLELWLLLLQLLLLHDFRIKVDVLTPLRVTLVNATLRPSQRALLILKRIVAAVMASMGVTGGLLRRHDVHVACHVEVYVEVDVLDDFLVRALLGREDLLVGKETFI